MQHAWNEYTADQYVTICAETLRSAINEACHRHGRCVLGLSGGSTPKPIYHQLGRMDLPWRQLEVFLIDERYVPANHADSNTALVNQTLLAACTDEWRASHFHEPKTGLAYDRCVVEYGERLTQLFAQYGGPHVITLGMGDDGHIASLFPEVPVAAEGPALTIGTTTDRFAVRERISVTFPVLRQSEQAFMLLKGAAKKTVWEQMTSDSAGPSRWPIKGIMNSLSVLYSS